MLWAEESNVLANGPLWGAASVIITGLGAWLISFYKERQTALQKEKVDVVLAWKEFSDARQVQDRATIAAQQLQLVADAAQVLDLTGKYARSEAELALSRVESESMRNAMFNMQKGCTLEHGCPALADPMAKRRTGTDSGGGL